MFASFRQLSRFLAGHPLTRDDLPRALGRVLRWQIQSRIQPTGVAVRFVDDTRLFVRRGMHGATGNIYAGLHEFAEMALTLHVLRAGDLFADIGANVGSYTVLAAGVRRARVVAVEPSSATRAALADNVAINQVHELVTIEPVALGDSAGFLAFSAGRDTTNHVLAAQGDGGERVHQTTADALFADQCPTMMKLDVEGYEAAVVAGADLTLRNPMLKALIVELNGSGRCYGFDDGRTHERLSDYGFAPYAYDPFRRLLTLRSGMALGNTIYVRDPAWVRQRTLTAPRFRVLHRTL